ncbi:MAG TPA: winged helix-turn-helix domain-containing protein [Phenylobacterium sp.]|uniref:winged helix-turn-helix domain-containing protein n=1 Tax=Phenylobacterium sp. TaxID=1871053 RepID=UPI002B91D169|nr:winged helix-turn-helix domain-containing protein [Phenylobacterium sp.]HSV02931.1 winged helix-turn-helix domain-containing protein [Phenylobacterium sp.]
MDKLSYDYIPPSRVDLAREADFRLGRCCIRPSRRHVEADGEVQTVQRRVMQVLVALATSTSEVVSRRELVIRCWAGLSVSDDAVDRCIGQLRRLASSWTDPPFEIMTIPGVGYRLEPSSAGSTPASSVRRAHRPRMAVLPFTTLSPDPSHGYLAEGIVEEIVTSLSLFTTFEVISAGAGIILEGRNLTPREAARELGVDYLLDGSVRRDGERIRVTVHLIDGRTGAELWADRVEDAGGDVFAIQDRVAERLAGALEAMVEDIGLAAASRGAPADHDSYDLLLRALEQFRLSGKAAMLESIELLERAIGLDPTFAVALGHSVVCHRQVVDHEWSDDTEMFRRRGLAYAQRALVAAPRDARVIAHVAAGVSGLDDSQDRGLALAEEAISLNPASAFVWLISGSIRLRAGEPDLAAGHLERSLRLDPISNRSGFARMYLASARFQQRRFDEALALFRTTTHRLPLSHAILASLHGHLGERDAGRQELANFERSDAGRIEKFVRIWFPGARYRALFLDGLSLIEDPGNPHSRAVRRVR